MTNASRCLYGTSMHNVSFLIFLCAIYRRAMKGKLIVSCLLPPETAQKQLTNPSESRTHSVRQIAKREQRLELHQDQHWQQIQQQTKEQLAESLSQATLLAGLFIAEFKVSLSPLHAICENKIIILYCNIMLIFL